MSPLVVVVPLKGGAYEHARSLLARGPAFDLATSELDRHEVYLTEREVVFVFEAPGLPAGGAPLWHDSAWQQLLDEQPRTAETISSWTRPPEGEAVSFEPTPGPGDSEGGDVFAPAD